MTMKEDTLHKLTERVKELTALHKTARILQDDSKSMTLVMAEVVQLLPPAWQYPEITAGRIRFNGNEAMTTNFRETTWNQMASFSVRDSEVGTIEVFYLEKQPPSDEGPFLKEERDLIESLAEMLRSYFQRQLSSDALRAAHDNLELLVKARTEELQKANIALHSQIAEYRKAEKRIAAYQRQLQQLASELSLAEARERRAIASDLHDHIGQALAFIKMTVSQFRGNAIFCGFEDKIHEIMHLIDQTIQYTRNLTFEISPPILYELGLEAALEWVAERFERKHQLKITIKKTAPIGRLADDVEVILFKSVQELLTNAVKHSGADKVILTIDGSGDSVILELSDNGCGFDMAVVDGISPEKERFGLFNIRERLSYLGGAMEIISSPGKGATIRLTAPHKPRGDGNEA
jgi:signal transduction histidine kinase